MELDRRRLRGVKNSELGFGHKTRMTWPWPLSYLGFIAESQGSVV